MADSSIVDSQKLVPVTVLLDPRLLETIDQLKAEFKLRSRGAIIERLLMELLVEPGKCIHDQIEIESEHLPGC